MDPTATYGAGSNHQPALDNSWMVVGEGHYVADTAWYTSETAGTKGIYLDGVYDGQSATWDHPQNGADYDINYTNGDGPVRIENASGMYSVCFQVDVAEFRVSSVVRSTAWIVATKYSNQDNLLSFEFEGLSNSPPVLNAIGGKTINEGSSLSFIISATDPANDTLIYSASNLPSGATFNTYTRAFSWTPRYGQAGVYVVHFAVSDGQLSDSEDVTITVVQLYPHWDVNGDGTSNVLDMVLVEQHWNEVGLTGWIREDVNEDGTANVLDMIIIGQHGTG